MYAINTDDIRYVSLPGLIRYYEAADEAEEALSVYLANSSCELLRGDIGCSLSRTLKPLMCYLEDLSDKRVLDLGCGSVYASLPFRGSPKYDTVCYEPWLCRYLHHIGADVVGVDATDNSSEKFESHIGNIMNPSTWELFEDNQFDIVTMFSVPSSHRSSGYRCKEVVDYAKKQCQRVLISRGQLFYTDV